MDDGFEFPAHVVLMKYNITEALTVEGAVRSEYLATELCPDLFPGRFARFDDLPGKKIRIDHNSPDPIEYFTYSGFSRSNSTCQSNHNQRNTPSLFL
jgi:hypothetical protein